MSKARHSKSALDRFKKRPVMRAGGESLERRDHRVRLVPEPVPPELTGKWIAWSPDGLKILLHGDSLHELRRDAKNQNLGEVMYEFIPPMQGTHAEVNA